MQEYLIFVDANFQRYSNFYLVLLSHPEYSIMYTASLIEVSCSCFCTKFLIGEELMAILMGWFFKSLVNVCGGFGIWLHFNYYSQDN